MGWAEGMANVVRVTLDVGRCSWEGPNVASINEEPRKVVLQFPGSFEMILEPKENHGREEILGSVGTKGEQTSLVV